MKNLAKIFIAKNYISAISSKILTLQIFYNSTDFYKKAVYKKIIILNYYTKNAATPLTTSHRTFFLILGSIGFNLTINIKRDSSPKKNILDYTKKFNIVLNISLHLLINY